MNHWCNKNLVDKLINEPPNGHYTLIGIDPGTNMGISIIEHDSSFNILNIEIKSYDINKYIRQDLPSSQRDIEKHLVIDRIITDLIIKHSPYSVTIEDAFSNGRFPASGLKLAGFVSIICLSITKVYKDAIIIKLKPKYIKSIVSTGEAKKNDMELAVMSHEELKPHLKNVVTTEHSIDAVAIAYSGLKILQSNLHVL